MTKQISRKNNFDLIRILAALQVVFFHGKKHLDISEGYILSIISNILKHFPGVPIFFVVSGFLVYWSFERNSNHLKKYFWHRALRIFPALWMCGILTFALLLLDLRIGVFEALSRVDILAWLGGQLSVFQFYTPDVFRRWGVGTPNGSLWTIPVEVQYYLAIPILYVVFKMLKRNWLVGFVIIFALSIASNVYISGIDGETMVRKFANVSLFPYLYYFMFGILAFKFWKKVRFLFEGTILYWLIGFVLYSYIFSDQLELYKPSYWINHVTIFGAHFLLSCVTLAFAFSNTTLSYKLLKGNDISYGVYIYHMPIVNLMIHRHYINNPKYIVIMFIATIVLAYLSWVYVEQPALRFKGKVS